MNTLHLSSVFPSFLYLGPWGCPQVLSPSMWVRMALFGARRTERTDLAMRKFRQGEFEYMVFFHVFFFQIWIQWIQWVPLYFQVFVGEIRGFFQHFPKFSGEIPGCSPIFRGTNRPGPARRPRRARAAAPCTWRRRTTASARRGSARWRCCWAHAPIRRHGGHGWEVIEVPLYPIITINGIVVNGE